MAILNITTGTTGLAAVNPSIIYIDTTNTYAQVTATGFLNNAHKEGYNFNDKQAALTTTTDLGAILLQVQIDTSGNVNLVSTTSSGDVQLPTTNNHIAVYTNSTGGLSEDAPTAINAGNIQAGLSGTAGTLTSYPATAAKGSLTLQATANAGNSPVIITNASMGQNTTITIPDPGASTGNVILNQIASGSQSIAGNVTLTTGDLTMSTGDLELVEGSLFIDNGRIEIQNPPSIGLLIDDSTGNSSIGLMNVAGANGCIIQNSTNATVEMYYKVAFPQGAVLNTQGYIATCSAANAFVTGNLVEAIGPDNGALGDAGIAVSNVQLKANIKAALVSGLGGSGATVSVGVTGLTSSSVVTCSISNSSNPCSVQKVTAGSGAFTLVLSADPGEILVVNYIAFLVAQ